MRRHLHIAAWLVRNRVFLFVAMMLVTLGSVFLIPHVTINGDMTLYLPDDSPMKQGMDLLADEMPAMQQFMRTEGNLVVNAMDLLPTDLPQTLATGFIFVFLVLLVMSASLMEVPLFLVTIGCAVLINMGTNAFFSSVSMMTNSLAAILQMVLSMDYSIILMNRYRQERALDIAPLPAMETAIGGAASSILSSAFTTIVSLLMLVFMKLKIGADLGFVLSKGVALSLLCNFTVLPCLIIWADKAIHRTAKKIPRFPAAGLARFQYRFRLPLALLFLGAFVAFWFLRKQTELYFAPDWDSKASETRYEVNTLLLLYETAEEPAVPAMLDSIATDAHVQRTISYPSLVDRPRTIGQLRDLIQEAGEEAPELPEEVLRLVYYAQTHPQRTERFSFQEIQDLVDGLSAQGLVPADMNPERIIAALMPEEEAEEEEAAPAPAPAEELPSVEPEQMEAAALPDSVQTLSPVPAPAPADTLQPFLTYADAIRLRDVDEMSAFLETDKSKLKLLYRLAGRRNGRMSLVELADYLEDHILTNRRYAALVPKDVRGDLARYRQALDSVMAVGPDTLQLPAPLVPLPEEILEAEAVMPAAAPEADTTVLVADAAPAVAQPAVEPAPTPQEELLDMALSSRRYTAQRMHRALSRAGIPVSQDQLDLLFLYGGALRDFDTLTAIAPGALLNYVADTLLQDPALAPLVDEDVRSRVSGAREQLLGQVGMLREPHLSAAVVMADYERESATAFEHVDRVRAAADAALQRPHYWVGESEMYKELKDGFPQELLLLTLLTVLAIFVIVALTFRSLLIPLPLLMTILAGIYANIWASGLGGHSLYYMSYLIIQGILMGATIDYTILFMTCYLSGRRSGTVAEALEGAYRDASHSILTSGLILAIVPYAMSVIMSDKVIGSILSSLAFGTAVILLFVFFLLPGVIAAMDPMIRRRREGVK